MGLKRVIKKGLLSGWSPLKWVGYDHIVDNAKIIKNIANGVITTPQKETSPRTFEECMQHYGVTEEGLLHRMRSCLRMTIACLLLSFGMAVYSSYLFVVGLTLSGVVCLILTGLLWAYAFREHFNYFQMKQRRLGCTFKEWFLYAFKLGESS